MRRAVYVVRRARLWILATLLSACASRPGGGDVLGAPGGSTAGLAAAAYEVGSSTDPMVVATDKGLVQGTQSAGGFGFLGIRLGKPTGTRHVMPPEVHHVIASRTRW
jgi:hypothetical protein